MHDEKPKLIFMHIPKTGGTTLDQVLNREARGNVYWLSGGARNAMQRLADMPRDEALSFDLYAGHLPWGLHTVIPSPCRYISMLRDPVERLVSHYYHVHGEPEHHSYKQVVEGGMSLLDFVSSDISVEIGNLQTRYFAGLEPHDIPLGQLTDEIYDLAIQHIEEDFAAIGVQEYFDHSLLLFGEVLGWKHKPFYTSKRVNTERPRRREIADDVRRIAAERNSFDLKLHTWAVERVRKAIDERGAEFLDRLASFRADLAAWQAEQSAKQSV